MRRTSLPEKNTRPDVGFRISEDQAQQQVLLPPPDWPITTRPLTPPDGETHAVEDGLLAKAQDDILDLHEGRVSCWPRAPRAAGNRGSGAVGIGNQFPSTFDLEHIQKSVETDHRGDGEHNAVGGGGARTPAAPPLTVSPL